MEKGSIERALCENLMIPASVMLGCQDADAHIISQYNLKEKRRKISETELINVQNKKISIPRDRLLNTIQLCHRTRDKCLSAVDTMSMLTKKYEIEQEQKSTSILSLVNFAVTVCPFCCKKQFKKEKPVLIRWSNGMLYKGYVLSKQGRLCYVELDNYNTAVLDCKDVFDEFEHEVMCNVCMNGRSEPPNEIVLCDCCNSGFHQKCHKPVITQDILSLDEDWFCARCEKSKYYQKIERGDNVEEPKYTLSTLACMALLCLGPSKRSDVHSWIEVRVLAFQKVHDEQKSLKPTVPWHIKLTTAFVMVKDTFRFYRHQKSDKWRTKLTITMSTCGHWINLDRETGMWQIRMHNLPALLRHLKEVTKDKKDVPCEVLDKILSGYDPKHKPLNFHFDFLPYDSSALTWDPKHRQNKEEVYCYCMGPGVWYKQMLQCLNCQQWFHQACVSCVTKPLLFGEASKFVCSICNFGEEHLSKEFYTDEQAMHLAMFHVVMTRYHGDFQLPVCLRMNVVPLLQVWDQDRYQDLQVSRLALIAARFPALFEPGAKHKNTTLYRLLVKDPPTFPVDRSVILPLPASPQPIPHFLPPGFVVELSNGTSGLQVDGSPPPEDFPPSHYDLSLFKDVDYYGKKKGKKGLQDQQKSKQSKGGKKRKISEGSPEKTSVAKKIGGAPTDRKPKRVGRTSVFEENGIKNETGTSPVAKSLTIKRLESGENYQILGKREGNDGKVEYLIAWEGVKSRCLHGLRRHRVDA